MDLLLEPKLLSEFLTSFVQLIKKSSDRADAMVNLIDIILSFFYNKDAESLSSSQNNFPFSAFTNEAG